MKRKNAKIVENEVLTEEYGAEFYRILLETVEGNALEESTIVNVRPGEVFDISQHIK